MDFKRIALVSAIAVFLAVFVISGIDLFVQRPDYSDFCKSTERFFYPKSLPEDAIANCTALSELPGDYEKVCGEKKGYVAFRYDSNGCATEKYCNTCDAEFQDKMKEINLFSYVFSVVLGSVAVVLGVFLPGAIESIASGILYGGMLILVFGTFEYGDLSNKYFRFFAIGFNLLLIIWATWRKIEVLRNPKAKDGAKGALRKAQK